MLDGAGGGWPGWPSPSPTSKPPESPLPVKASPSPVDECLPTSGPLPAFITGLRCGLADHVVVFLKSRGALNVPGPAFVASMFRVFFHHMYPYLPVLELDSFLDAVTDPTGKSGRISLLIVHAMMAAAATCADEADLRRAGFGNRQDARQSFLDKFKVCAPPFLTT